MTRAFQDHEIRQYLLDDIPAAVEGELESAFFRDPELLARVEVARDDLFDDYAARRLSDADREKFERRLLASDEGVRGEFLVQHFRISLDHFRLCHARSCEPSWPNRGSSNSSC